MKKNSFFILFSISLCLFAGKLNAAVLFSHAEIQKLAENTVKAATLANSQANQKVNISASKLDPRIHIQPCSQKLQANVVDNNNSRNINVKITCSDENAWFLYVPVRRTILSPVLVTTLNLHKGALLTNENITVDYLPEYKIRGAVLENKEAIVGARLKRNVRKHAPIYANYLCVVCKDEKVTIIAKAKDFSIKSDGIALESGILGEQVAIKNVRSGKRIFASISGINKVTINL